MNIAYHYTKGDLANAQNKLARLNRMAAKFSSYTESWRSRFIRERGRVEDFLQARTPYGLRGTIAEGFRLHEN